MFCHSWRRLRNYSRKGKHLITLKNKQVSTEEVLIKSFNHLYEDAGRLKKGICMKDIQII